MEFSTPLYSRKCTDCDEVWVGQGKTPVQTCPDCLHARNKDLVARVERGWKNLRKKTG
jgi:hypothetical protein